MLHKCGYPRWAFQKAEKKTVTNTDSQKGQKQSTGATIPYIAGVSEWIKKVYAQFRISTSFRPYNKLRNSLVRVKDIRLKDKRSHVVYGISCAEPDCQETYMGETKQALKSRIHQRPSSGETYDSAVYTHLHTSGHSINLKEVVILDREQDWFRRGIREAVHERFERP